MKKIIIILPILLGLAAIILLLVVVFKTPIKISTLSLDNSIISQPGQDVLSASQKGVDLTINGVKRENNQTIIELALNNHAYDLSKLEVKSQSSLAGVSPNDYKIINSASGGHHVLAQIIFPGVLTGLLIIN